MSVIYDVYNTPHLKNVFAEINRRIKRGERLVLRFEKVTKRKSHKQLRNLFGNLVTPLAEYLSAESGITIEPLAMERELLKRYSALAESPVLKFGFDLRRMRPEVIPTRLSEMDTAQAADFTNWCVEFIRERFPELNLPPYVDYLFMNRLAEEKIRQIEYESRKWEDRDRRYLDHIRSKPCIVCGRVAAERNEAHHLRDITLGSGVAEKVADYYTVPLCRECHQALHDKGTGELCELIAPVLHEQGINVFCKVCYYRWMNHF